MKNMKLMLSILLLSTAILGCGEEDSSFSLLDTTESFRQTDGTSNTKVDILWVIDNSGSMESSQQNVINNLNSFIQDFSNKGLDFKMAVTTTDAYKTVFNGNTNCSRFRDGILNSSCNTLNSKTYSGVRIMTRLTADLASVFMLNASQTDSANNIFGSGDERAFQSMQTALNNVDNAGFVRPDSFVSVIMVSDEEDFSHSGSSLNESYANPNLYTVQSYVDYLDQLTNSTPQTRRYNVNTMAIFDETCRASLNTTFMGRKIATRLGQLVDNVNTAFAVPESRGLKTSLCGNFADDLKNIASNILSLASRFTLKRLPIVSSIVVTVNNVVVPEQSVNPLNDGGWVYEAATNSVLFVGSNYIPPQGSSIHVAFDPQGYGI